MLSEETSKKVRGSSVGKREKHARVVILGEVLDWPRHQRELWSVSYTLQLSNLEAKELGLYNFTPVSNWPQTSCGVQMERKLPGTSNSSSAQGQLSVGHRGKPLAGEHKGARG